MLLSRDQNDFFAKDNYFMIVSTVKLTSTIVSTLVSANFVKKTEDWSNGYNLKQRILFDFYFVWNVLD